MGFSLSSALKDPVGSFKDGIEELGEGVEYYTNESLKALGLEIPKGDGLYFEDPDPRSVEALGRLTPDEIENLRDKAVSRLTTAGMNEAAAQAAAARLANKGFLSLARSESDLVGSLQSLYQQFNKAAAGIGEMSDAQAFTVGFLSGGKG
ncbi:MAG: hypothetical protein C0609_01170 [Deltaproteobacteria bacterium]|nr:MAG: hypothetical protein C0609_01170 [Deltaproteobacteria bacterium]